MQFFCGRYVDRVGRREGVWRIAYRNLVHDFSGSLDLGQWGLGSVAEDAFVRGARRQDDSSPGQSGRT
ncbi:MULTISPECIES: hypothetical protein [unclassified Streptomyces]|uniref:hypothetical protein n=1 Tax=unclassified Streptomyces TaxID=2593676 RepID=UPI0036EA9FBE